MTEDAATSICQLNTKSAALAAARVNRYATLVLGDASTFLRWLHTPQYHTPMLALPAPMGD